MLTVPYSLVHRVRPGGYARQTTRHHIRGAGYDLSEEEREFVRSCLYPEDHELNTAFCGDAAWQPSTKS